MSHHCKGRCGAFRVGTIGQRTVDGNGNALGEDVAVGTLEGGDLAELVELEVLSLDTLGRLGVNDVKVEAVGLCDGQQGGGTGVTLSGVLAVLYTQKMVEQKWLDKSEAYRVGVELSERRHCEGYMQLDEREATQRGWSFSSKEERRR
jgi:hypothetical protein